MPPSTRFGPVSMGRWSKGSPVRWSGTSPSTPDLRITPWEGGRWNSPPVSMLGPLDIAQQVRQTFLLLGADDRVVGGPEVGHQHPGELLLEELLQRRRPPAPVDHVVGQIGRREAPQPMGLALDPPA